MASDAENQLDRTVKTNTWIREKIGIPEDVMDVAYLEHTAVWFK